MADQDPVVQFLIGRGLKLPQEQPASSGVQPGGYVTDLSPVQQASQQEYNLARSAAGSFYDRVYPLTQAIQLLQKLGEGGTGPGSERLNEMFSAYITMAPEQFKKLWKPDAERVAQFDEIRKYLNEYAQNKANQANLGPHTNAGLETTQSANPSVNISNLASTKLAIKELALQRMNHAGYLNSLQQGIPSEQWSDYLPKYKSTVDPRAYTLDVLTPAERNQLFDEVGKADPEQVKRFMDAVNFGFNNRIMDRPPVPK